MRISNTARSFSEIAPQASIFVPATVPAGRLPSYIHLDPTSEWHKSALILTAWESLTLPSRLRLSSYARETLNQLENTLNINGNQNIARLQLSLPEKGTADRDINSAFPSAHNDRRTTSSNDHAQEDEYGDADVSNIIYDVDFFNNDDVGQHRRRKSFNRNHVFGRAQNLRAGIFEEEIEGHGTDDLGHERARRRAAGLSITRKYAITSLKVCRYASRPLLLACEAVMCNVMLTRRLGAKLHCPSRSSIVFQKYMIVKDPRDQFLWTSRYVRTQQLLRL